MPWDIWEYSVEYWRTLRIWCWVLVNIFDVILGVHLQSPISSAEQVLYSSEILSGEIPVLPELSLHKFHETRLALYWFCVYHSYTLAIQMDNFLLEST